MLCMDIFLQTKHHHDNSIEYMYQQYTWRYNCCLTLFPLFCSPPSLPLSLLQFNMSHTIHYLSFGDTYPGQHNPLDGYTQVSVEDLATGMYIPFPTCYHMKV